MAWFWNSQKKEKREIHSIKRKGHSHIYEITFKGRGPYGGREVREYNLMYEKDPFIKKAIETYAYDEKLNTLQFSLDYCRKLTPEKRKKSKYYVFNEKTYNHEFIDYDNLLKLAKKEIYR